MKLRFFVPETPASLPELKRRYHALALKYHPDHGGNEEDMKALIAEYEYLFSNLKNKKEDKEGNVYTSEEEVNETPEQYVRIVEALINCVGLKLEVCGDWLWVSGNTQHWEARLDSAGFFKCPKKRLNGIPLWAYNFSPKKKKYFSRGWSMNRIRGTFGSRNINIPRGNVIEEEIG